MGSFIFWIIILVFIISSVRKGKRKTGTLNETEAQRQRYVQPQKAAQSDTAWQTVKKQKTEQTAKKQKAGQNYTAQQTEKKKKSFDTSYKKKKKVGTESKTQSTSYTSKEEKAQRQRTSVTEEQQSIFDQNEIVAAAKANTREVERDNDRDAENQNLMEEVYEVMVKGPETNIEFQRDFIAEGLDMLNAFQDL